MHMRRGLILASAVAFALSAVLAQSLAVPQRVVACSCITPLPSLAETVAGGGDMSVLTGTVGPPQAEVTPIQVEAWFHGGRPADVVWVSGGTQMMSSCDVMFSAGQRWFLVLYGEPGQPYSTNLCAPNAMLGTAEADELVAQAVDLFGPAQPTPTAEPPPEAPAEPSPLLSGGMLWVVAAVAVTGALFAAVFVIARRRPLS
jgi:hypothetical protein